MTEPNNKYYRFDLSVMQINRLVNFQLIMIVAIGVLFVALPFILPTIDWEDYSITFNGTWLMYNGYEPYKDFGIPTGLGSFLMPYLSFVLFGPNYNSLYIMQGIEHVLLMYLTYQLFKALFEDKIIQKLATGFTILTLAFFVTLNTKAQFYNTEFLIYEIGALAWLMKAINATEQKSKIIHAVITALFVFLCAQVKQDYGLFCLLITTTVFIFYSIVQRTYIQLWVFVSSLTLFILIFLSIIDTERFFYWFNLGNGDRLKQSVLTKIMKNILQGDFLKILLLIVLDIGLRVYGYIKQPHQRSLLYFIPTLLFCGLGLQNIVTLSTSNFPYLFYAATFLIASILVQGYALLKHKTFAFMSVNIIVILFLYNNAGQVYKSIFYFYPKGILMTTKETDQTNFKVAGVNRNYKENSGDFKYCQLLLDSLYKAKKAPLTMVNFTDLPLEMEVPSQRINGLPLWPDNNVLLFDNEKKRYLELVNQQQFDVIFILELEFEGSYFTNHDFKNAVLNQCQFIKTFPIAKYDNKRHISIFIRKQ
ncbi:MAG: hypothetical protein V4613_10615 [Bacteroidota bacterium]